MGNGYYILYCTQSVTSLHYNPHPVPFSLYVWNLRFFNVFPIVCSNNTVKWVRYVLLSVCIITFLWYIWEVKEWLSQCHTANKWQSWDQNPLPQLRVYAVSTNLWSLLMDFQEWFAEWKHLYSTFVWSLLLFVILIYLYWGEKQYHAYSVSFKIMCREYIINKYMLIN